MIEIRHVLCPVDFSDFSRRAVDHAIAVARWYGARLTVLYVHHVEVPGIAEFAGLGTGPPEFYALSPADRGQLREGLRSMVRAEAVKNIPVEFSVAVGDAAVEIVAAAESADMLVMGTHGRSGFEHVVLGSVTEKVLRKAACPVPDDPSSITRCHRRGPGAVSSHSGGHRFLTAVDGRARLCAVACRGDGCAPHRASRHRDST